MCQVIGTSSALWSITAKNPDGSTGPVAHPLARSLAPLTRSLATLTRSLATHYSLRSLVRSLVLLLAPELVVQWNNFVP